MKVFGSTGRIAVQVEPREPAGEFAVGHICLWADGIRIGDYEQVVLLRLIADVFRDTIRAGDRRVDPELAALSPEQILGAVKAVLFDHASSDLLSDPKKRRRLERYRKLCICPNGSEAFDGELALLIERDASRAESFIWQAFTDQRVRELRLPGGEYEEVMRGFLAWADPLTGYDPASHHFAGKSFVIVGNLSRPHSEIAGIIRRLGGRIDHEVTDNTSYVLAGQLRPELPPALVEARALGVPILSEAEFERLLPAPSSDANHSEES